MTGVNLPLPDSRYTGARSAADVSLPASNLSQDTRYTGARSAADVSLPASPLSNQSVVSDTK